MPASKADLWANLEKSIRMSSRHFTQPVRHIHWNIVLLTPFSLILYLIKATGNQYPGSFKEHEGEKLCPFYGNRESSTMDREGKWIISFLFVRERKKTTNIYVLACRKESISGKQSKKKNRKNWWLMTQVGSQTKTRRYFQNRHIATILLSDCLPETTNLKW